MRFVGLTLLVLAHVWGASAKAQDQALPPPTLVDFTCTAASPYKAIPDLARLVGVDVVVQHAAGPGRPTTLTANFEHMPFWQAFLKLTGTAGLHVDQMGTRRLRVEPNGAIWPDQPSSYWQGCAVMLANSRRSYRIGYGDSPWTQRHFDLHMHLLADPALAILGLYGPPKIREAVDENGTSLLRTNGWEVEDARGDRRDVERLIFPFDVSLTYPPSGGKKIAMLKGELSAVTCALEEIAMRDPLKGEVVTRSLPRFTVTLGPLAHRDGAYELPVTITPASDPGGGLRTTPAAYRELLSTIVLSDGAERRYQPPETRTQSGRAEGAYIARFASAEADVPTRLIWRIPKQTRLLKIPFELRDIEIP